MTLRVTSTSLCFGGKCLTYTHPSTALACPVSFTVYLPPAAEHEKVPVLYFLSGLTCTEQNVTTKSGMQRYASEHGIAIVAPDTSPRGTPPEAAIPDEWDFGEGAGFYLDANQLPWSKQFRMLTYVTSELVEIVNASLPVDPSAAGITGHSMGGHGALVLGLRFPQLYRSISAFAPVCAPSRCPWGQKAFSRYLGEDRAAWAAYDATELIATHARPSTPIVVDQGSADDFLETQLKPHLFEAACAAAGQPLELRFREGYDHSYFFIATFIGEHIAFHARELRK